MQTFENVMAQGMGEISAWLPNLIAATVVMLVAFVVGHAAARIVDGFTDDRREALPTARLTKRLVRWTVVLIGFILALQILGLTAVATSLLATGGFAAVVLGFAFREIGENLLAGLVLGMSRSFEIGDLIESSGHTGEVKEIDLRHVHLRTADGRDVWVPSASILRNPLVNFTRDGLRRGDFVIGIDYGDRLELALRSLLDATREVGGVLKDPKAGVRVDSFESQYVQLRVLFWVDTDAESGLSVVKSKVMQACQEALRDAGLTFSADVSSSLKISPLEVSLDRE